MGNKKMYFTIEVNARYGNIPINPTEIIGINTGFNKFYHKG